MEDGKTIISIAFPYLYDNNINGKVYFSNYTRGRDYHLVLIEYMKKICMFIEGMDAKAMYFVDSNALPERYIASLSGLGFIGKNNMLITQKYGSYVFLGEIITDLKIKQDKKLEQKCGNCEICLSSCPTSAIVKGKVGINNNSNICLSYITQKKDIEDFWFDKLDGRLFGCDTCQRVCPYNKEVKLSVIKEFKPYEHMKTPNLKELMDINNISFKENYKITSCGWRGKNIIRRNAIINSFFIEKAKIITSQKDTSLI